MNAPTSITASLDADTLTTVRALALARGMTAEEYVVEAVRRAADSDRDFRAFVQVGVDAADRGELIAHEDVMAQLDAMIEKHRGRCAG